jgi:hypothetical protein
MSDHEHTKRCYWDFREARWVCRPTADDETAVTEFPAVVVTTEQPVATAEAS